mmetsp:Transcript_28025/g.70368  ORF Transcript_28025/g.70368 Transcript_28025/m.70368 type:complete len:197 (+) Transcript_28025:155-745(+)
MWSIQQVSAKAWVHAARPLSFAQTRHSDGICQRTQNLLSGAHVNACISDALAVRERLASLQILSPGNNVAFNHDPNYRAAATLDLLRQISCHDRLVTVILAAISMAAVNHHNPRQFGLLQHVCGYFYACFIVVGATGGPTEYCVAALVAIAGDDCCQALSSDSKERVWLRHRTQCIYNDLYVTIRSILEANGAGNT